MSKFEDVKIVKKANVYFDGKVTSRTIEFDSGEIKTLGVILPGEYEFNVGKKEIMEMIQGEAEVMVAGEDEWKAYSAGDVFEVPANSSFKIRTDSIADYCCSFVD